MDIADIRGLKHLIMQKHHDTGFKGEAIAINWLSRQGFLILRTNWRYSHYELDIIAERGNMLHFIEVKTRSGLRYGYPEEGVTLEKIKRMKMAGAAYLCRYDPHRFWVQYCIVSILMKDDRVEEIKFIEDIE
ncbi:MAG: YraN family protein [Bacteroidota bacterium]